MFQDESVEGVDFESCWKKDKYTSEASAQTSEVLTSDESVQATHPQPVAVQTDAEEVKPFGLVVDNSKELQDFLKRVEPLVYEQLQLSSRSHAFDGYQVSWDEESASVTCSHTLTQDYLSHEYNCTGLSWNSSGSVLAVAYGRLDHQDWCSHRSLLCTWNLDRRSLNSEKPDASIDINSCLMCVAFHPMHPAMVAGGTFNGDIHMWNTSAEGDPLLASSRLSELGHKEPVAKVAWILDEDSRQQKYFILSLGNDGKVLVWECVEGVKELTLVRGYRLLTESIPHSVRISRAKGKGEIGGTCLAFSHEDKSLFVVGSENGGVFKCSLQTAVIPSIDKSTVESDLLSPIQFVFCPHHGPVYDISWSPFHRNVFLTCGTDTLARVFSQLDYSPVLSVEPACGYLFSVCWSQTRPLVFAVGTGNGKVLIYDLKVSHIKPSVCLEASPHQRPVYSLLYNAKRPQLLASGDASGVVKVWRLSTQLTSQGRDEVEQLSSLAAEVVTKAVTL